MPKFRMLRCSFCRKSETEVAKLVAGPRVYICDECVAAASRIMESRDDSQPPIAQPTIWRKVAARVRDVFAVATRPTLATPALINGLLLKV